jgi:hypothetical protein
VKDIFNEHWDDTQLKAMQLGGNKALFDIMKEYEIQELENKARYNHKVLRWYRMNLCARMVGEKFDEPKPGKTFKEDVQKKSEYYRDKIKHLEEDISPYTNEALQKSSEFANKIDQAGKKFL